MQFFMQFIDYQWEDWLTAREAAILLEKALIPYELKENYASPERLKACHRLIFSANETEEVILLLKTWECLPQSFLDLDHGD